MLTKDIQSLKILFENDDLYTCQDDSESIIGNKKSSNMELCVFTNPLSSDLAQSIDKMLKAVSYDDTSYTVLEVPNNQYLSFKKAQKHFNFDKALIFGLTPKRLLLNISPNYYTKYTVNDIKILFSVDFAQINEQRNLNTHKIPLWNQVKNHFTRKR